LSELVSTDGNFTVKRTRDTLSIEEIPEILDALSKILDDAKDIAIAVASGNLTRMARDIPPEIISIYEQILRIKKEIED